MNAFLIVDSSYSKFKLFIEVIKENNRIIPLHEDYSGNDNLSKLHKQIQVVAAYYFIEEDNEQLAIYQRDINVNTPLVVRSVNPTYFNTITIIAFMESLFIIKYIISVYSPQNQRK